MEREHYCQTPKTIKKKMQTVISEASTYWLNLMRSLQTKQRRKASQSAWAAIRKCHRPAGLNNRNLFLTVLEAKKSKIKVPADSVFGEGSLAGL